MPKEEYKIDGTLIRLLVAREGRSTIAVLEDGSRLRIANIAWGYDWGDDFAHITTNISPEVDGFEIGFFFTNELKQLLDPETGQSLYELPFQPRRS